MAAFLAQEHEAQPRCGGHRRRLGDFFRRSGMEPPRRRAILDHPHLNGVILNEAKVEFSLEDGLELDGLRFIHTPGHSPGGICIHVDGMVFTGDTLFVGGVGRTDLPGGSSPLMLRSIQTKLLTLPDETIVLPGHNYGAAPTSTIKQERLHNPFLQ